MAEDDFQQNSVEESPEENYQDQFVPEQDEYEEQSVTDIDENNMFAAMSYLGVLVLVPLFFKKENPFVQFHAKQGLVILVGLVVAFASMFLNGVVGSFLFLTLFLVSIVGLVQSLQGRRWKIPGIGDIADKFNI